MIDGDTVQLASRERVRLLDIDAPELHAGRKGHAGPFPEPGAVEARDALRAMVEGRRVQVERHGRDKYGRTLARVIVDGVDVGAELLSRGLVKPYAPGRPARRRVGAGGFGGTTLLGFPALRRCRRFRPVGGKRGPFHCSLSLNTL